MSGTIYGYARVSTQLQNEARQLAALREFGVPEKNIIVEKQSGKDYERPYYQRLVRKLRSDDILVVPSIDRLGRDYAETLEQWRYITQKRKAAVVVLDMPLLDTREGRDLTGKFVADLVLQILSYVAQQERENIRQRQAEGIAAAKQRGVQFGRKPLPPPKDFEDVAQDWQDGIISARAAALQLGMSRSTFSRKARARQESQLNEIPCRDSKPTS